MKVCIYGRVSSGKHDTDLSTSAQLRALREYARKNGHEIVRELVDEAESGRTASRPAFREMIALARLKTPPFEAILVWKLNRFSRSRADSITYKTLLRNKGIEVISINEPTDDSPTGRLIEGVIESIDEFYSANLGQDIRRGLRENASRGFFTGSRAPYGYRRVEVRDGAKTRHKLELEPEDSAAVQTVRRMFDLAARDAGCKEIAKALNCDGLRTATGERWGRVTVHKVLTNEAYCGTLVWGALKGHAAARGAEPPVRVENAWPAVVDRDTFLRIQKKMGSRSPRAIHPRRVPSTFLLSGLLFCSCGRALTGCSAKSGRHFYYICCRNSKQRREACDARMLPKEMVERQVIGQLRARVLTEENLESLVTMVNEELQALSASLNDRLEVIDLELRDVKARMARLYEALETGKLDLDDLAPRIKELRLRQDELARARVTLEAEAAARGVQPVDEARVKAYAWDLGGLLAKAEITERRAFLRSFVDRIEVDKGRVSVHYRLPWPRSGKASEPGAVLPTETSGGAEGIRTPDLLRAREALSQLSYSPTR